MLYSLKGDVVEFSIDRFGDYTLDLIVTGNDGVTNKYTEEIIIPRPEHFIEVKKQKWYEKRPVYHSNNGLDELKIGQEIWISLSYTFFGKSIPCQNVEISIETNSDFYYEYDKQKCSFKITHNSSKKIEHIFSINAQFQNIKLRHDVYKLDEKGNIRLEFRETRDVIFHIYPNSKYKYKDLNNVYYQTWSEPCNYKQCSFDFSIK
jgi:hypothetical protein